MRCGHWAALREALGSSEVCEGGTGQSVVKCGREAAVMCGREAAVRCGKEAAVRCGREAAVQQRVKHADSG